MSEQKNGAAFPVIVFYSYAHEDEPLRNELAKHLSSLQREGLITGWYDRQIVAGTDWSYAINAHLATASIILLLISPAYIASDYCYSVEMQQAMVRHTLGEARVIPVILRPVDWQGAPFASLKCLPHDAKPVTLWANQDEAFLDVVNGIRAALHDLYVSPKGFSHVSETHRSSSSPSIISEYSLSSHELELRHRLLNEVDEIWIKGLLDRSLNHAVLIKLGLHERSDVVANPWRMIVQELDLPPRPLPSNTRITHVYDEAQGELLILGEPGSGKTTLLLELTRDLLERARHDNTHPIPVIFNLSSWTTKRQSLVGWMVEELHSRYRISTRMGRLWVTAGRVLPMLDGLDEVAAVHRTECVHAINAYLQRHETMPCVVCSRSTEYLDQKIHVLLRRAIIVQPLTAQQIDDYLSSAGEQLEAVRGALRDDADLRELVATPLMLSVLALTYSDRSIEDLQEADAPEMRRQHLFKQYTERMFERRGVETRYTYQQTLHWLKWLAQQLLQHNQTQFYIERIQPDWLPKSMMLRLLYRFIAVAIFYGIFFGLVGVLLDQQFGVLPGVLVGLVIGALNALVKPIDVTVIAKPWWHTSFKILFKVLFKVLLKAMFFVIIGVPIFVWADASFRQIVGITCVVTTCSLSDIEQANGIFFGIIAGIFGCLVDWQIGVYVRPVEVVVFSWKRMGIIFGAFLLACLCIGLLVGFVFALNKPSLALPFFREWLSVGGSVGLLLGIFFGLFFSWSVKMLDEHAITKPNQGIHAAARNMRVVGITVGVSTGLITGITLGILGGLPIGLFFGLFGGLFAGLVNGLFRGGTAYIQHILLRLFLQGDDSIPSDYSDFLDYADKIILLRKVGGGYIFIHRLLRDYFATIDMSANP